MTDLGDKVIPFPNEFSTKLTQEFIWVFGIDVGLLLAMGSGLSALAFVLERKRVIGIVKIRRTRSL